MIALLFAAILATVPTFAPTSGVGEYSIIFNIENSQAIGIASLGGEAPQVGFEPTTLRLTEGLARENLTFAGNDLAATPVVRGEFGFASIRPNTTKSPHVPPCERAVGIVARRGYWASAPPIRRCG